MKIAKTPVEWRVWRKVEKAQAAGEPLPVFEGEEAEAFNVLLQRFGEQQKEVEAEQWRRRVVLRLKDARRWAYGAVLSFQKSHAAFHPLLLEWARKNLETASDEQWIAAAKEAHRRQPIPFAGRDTLPITPETLGRPQKMRAEVSAPVPA